MRKVALVLSFLLVTAFCSAQDRVPTAEEVLNTAYAQASKENKNVLLIFHASWCGWCRKMDSSLKSTEVQPLINKNYLVAHLAVYESQDKKELENSGALKFLTDHQGAEKGIPYWMILNKNGHLLANSEYKPGRNSGCPASEEEVAYFVSVLKKTSALTEDDLKVIARRFRMNDSN